MARKAQFSNLKIFIFVAGICFTCALILSILADFLREPQARAKELYKSKQLLLAARILSYEGHFLVKEGDQFVPAIYDSNKQMLLAADSPLQASNRDILDIFQSRILIRLTDSEGKLYTFKEAGIDEQAYLIDNEKLGYSHLPYKLVYIVEDNLPPYAKRNIYGYVIPVNGYGLWDAIYGYLGLAANANTILGMTWYDQKETPGLGGDIALPRWQKQFWDKIIFQKDASGQTDPKRARLEIKVVKTSVQETYSDSPEADSAVDGIAGASITVIGVNEAMQNSLAPYRQFLIQAYEKGRR